MTKQTPTVEMMQMIIEQLSIAPKGQCEDYVREDCKKFKSENHTPSEMYDFIVKISKIPVLKISNDACVGNISTFVQKLCELDKYYLRPNDLKYY